MTNIILAKNILNRLHDLGVNTIALCPGARNSPFVELLSTNAKFKVLHFFDERAAAFYLLGKIQTDGKPAAVVTTSGTAVGELLPAMMEAHYSRLPLIALTADRPKRFRETGAPQTAEQVGIFGKYSSFSYDFDLLEVSLADKIAISESRPLHINACFEEPLPAGPEKKISEMSHQTESDQTVDSVTRFIQEHHGGILAVLGGMTEAYAFEVKEFLLKANILFYAEGPSRLREDSDLKHLRLLSLDRFLDRAMKASWKLSAVLRIGDVPTHRLWRDLEYQIQVPVLSINNKPFSGLPNGYQLTATDPNVFTQLLNKLDVNSSDQVQDKAKILKTLDQMFSDRADKLIEKWPLSEPALFRQISMAIPAGSRVYVGNSLPIRQWDMAATRAIRGLVCMASRGLNGIDGQISTFLGGVENHAGPSVGIVGDLTALYDLQGPWVVSQWSKEAREKFCLVIINNSGGKIFERIFKNKKYSHEHNLRFKAFAEMWGLKYLELDLNTQKHNSFKEHQNEILNWGGIVEILPSSIQTEQFWNDYDAL